MSRCGDVAGGRTDYTVANRVDLGHDFGVAPEGIGGGVVFVARCVQVAVGEGGASIGAPRVYDADGLSPSTLCWVAKERPMWKRNSWAWALGYVTKKTRWSRRTFSEKMMVSSVSVEPPSFVGPAPPRGCRCGRLRGSSTGRADGGCARSRLRGVRGLP